MSDFGHTVVFMRFKFTVSIFGFFHLEESSEKVIGTRIQYFKMDLKRSSLGREVLLRSWTNLLEERIESARLKWAILFLSKTSSIVCISTGR